MATFIINGWTVYHVESSVYMTTSPKGHIIEGYSLAHIAQQILDWQPA